MLQHHLRARRRGDLARSSDQRLERRLEHREADPRGRQDRVEGAAEGDVEADRAEALRRYREIEMAREGGDALEGDLARAGLTDLDGDAHHAAGAFEIEAGDRALDRHQLVIDGPAADGDGGVATHRAVAGIMREEHGEIGLGVAGLDRDHAVHVRVSARLQHQASPDVVELRLGQAPLLQDAGTGQRRISLGDDAHGLARRVHVECPISLALHRDRSSVAISRSKA